MSDPFTPHTVAEIWWPADKYHDQFSNMTSSEGLVYCSYLSDGYLFRYAPQGTTRVTNISRAGYRSDHLRPRNLLYTDRPYEYTAPLPIQDFKEQTYLLTRHNDKYSTGSSFLRFTIDRPSTVYVAYDDRASAPPPWLARWFKKSLRLTSNDRLSPGRILYARDFPAGEVTLGGNRDATVPAPDDLEMYGVLIVPRKSGVSNWTQYN